MNKILASNFAKNFFVLAIFLILGLVVFFWFGDYLFAGTDVNYPVLRSASMYNRFFTWTSTSTGAQSISMQIMIPYGLFLIISEKINLSLPLTQHIWFYYIFVLSGLSAYLFSKQIIKKVFNADAIIPAIIAGIIYMANPFVAVMSSTFTHQWLVYAFMPLILYLVIIGFSTPPKLRNTIFRVLLFFVVSSSVNTNPKYLILTIMPCVFLLIIYLCFEKNKIALKHTLIYSIQFFGLLILFNLYWLIPQMYLIKDSMVNIKQAYESLSIPRSLGYLYNSASGALNGIRLIGHKALTGNYMGIAYYKYSNFLFSPLYGIIGLLPFFLSLYVIMSKKKIINIYAYIFCIFMLVLSIFGMLGSTLPASRINSFFVEKIPLYLDLFSNPYPIFSIYYLVALSTLVSLAIFILKTKIIRLRFIFKAFIAAVLVIVIFLIGKPVWTGELIRKSNFEENKNLTSHLYKIPNYYYLIKNKISAESTDKINFRILSIPYPTQGIVVYQWENGGYSGGEVGSGWIGDILQGTNLAAKSLIEKILNGEIITDDLANLGIKYIIFHKDANPLMYNGAKFYGGGKQILEKNINDSLDASNIQYEVSYFDSVILYALKHNDLNLKTSLLNQNLSQGPIKDKEKIEKANKPFNFLPHFYTSSSLIIPSASIDNFFNIFPATDYNARVLIYFKEQNKAIPNKVIEKGEGYLPLFSEDNNIKNTIVDNGFNGYILKENINSKSDIRVNYVQEGGVLVFSNNVESEILINEQPIKESPVLYELSAKIGDIVKIGRKFIVVSKNMEESVGLTDRFDVYEKGADLNSFDLNANLSFESGLWQEKPNDCANGMAGEPDLSMQLSNDATDGKKSLELGSKNHSACASKSFPVELSANKIYKYSFDYKNVKGDDLILYYNLKGKEKSYPFSEVVEAENHGWNHYETFIEPQEDISSIDLYFYALSDGTKEVVNRFDNIKIEEWMPKDLFNYYLYSPAKEQIKTPFTEFKKINPTKYRIRIHQATGSFPLVFSESFDKGWKAYIVKSYKVNKVESASMENYKILDGNEEDQATKEELQEFINKGWISNLGNNFISKNFQDTIQNDNLPNGSIFETWFKKPAVSEENHLTANGYANSWFIETEELCSENPAQCIKNADGSYDFEMVVEFRPQRLFCLGLGISGLTLFGCLFYLYWIARRKINNFIRNLFSLANWKNNIQKTTNYIISIPSRSKAGAVLLLDIIRSIIDKSRKYIKDLAGVRAEKRQAQNQFVLEFTKKTLNLEKEKLALEKEKLYLEKDKLLVIKKQKEIEEQKISAPPVTSVIKNYDENVLTESTIDDIDLDFISAKKSKIEERLGKTFANVDDLLQELGCLTKNNIPTHAGILLSGKEPQKYFKNSYLTFIKYDSNYNIEENFNFKGNLIKIIEESFKRIKELIPVKEVVNGDTVSRQKVPNFPYIAVRELLINAVAHRDYAISGSRIIISMYEDRMEFQSPGSLPNNITPAAILKAQYSRNPVIAEILYYLGYIEQLGSGMDRVFQLFNQLNKKEPKIEDFGNMVIVTIYKI